MKLEELLADDAFMDDLVNSKTYEEAQEKLDEKDVDITVEELKNLYDLAQKQENGEALSEEDLEKVEGGMLFVRALPTGGLLKRNLKNIPEKESKITKSLTLKC